MRSLGLLQGRVLHWGEGDAVTSLTLSPVLPKHIRSPEKAIWKGGTELRPKQETPRGTLQLEPAKKSHYLVSIGIEARALALQ